jgi:uncharacterized protein YecE (DUF72 family)
LGVREVHVGCSGWNYRDWRGAFYPEGVPASRWLEHYAQRFTTVEVNTTFYRLTKRDTVARWVEQTPPGFLFAVKGSRYLTHMRRLQDRDRGLHRFFDPLAPMIEAGKLGPVLWQLPATFRRDDELLDAWLEALRAFPAPGHALEFRDASWFHPAVEEILRRHGAALVIAHRRGELAFQTEAITTDWTFVRFHFGDRGRRGNYSDTELREWAARIDGFRRRAEVFAYFNNDWEAFAPRNGLALQRELAR